MNQSSSTVVEVSHSNNFAISIFHPLNKIHPLPSKPQSKITIHSVSNSPLKLQIHSPSSKTVKTFRFTTGDILKSKLKDFRTELNSISLFKLNDTEQNTQTCRICLDSDKAGDLISPCACKGFQQFVHQDCLKLWLLKSDKVSNEISSCEVCLDEFSMNFEYIWKFDACSEVACRFWLPFIIACCMISAILSFYFQGLIKSTPGGIVVMSISVIFGVIALIAITMAAFRAKAAFFEKFVIGWSILNKSGKDLNVFSK